MSITPVPYFPRRCGSCCSVRCIECNVCGCRFVIELKAHLVKIVDKLATAHDVSPIVDSEVEYPEACKQTAPILFPAPK